jgi:hypothetical protein
VSHKQRVKTGRLLDIGLIAKTSYTILDVLHFEILNNAGGVRFLGGNGLDVHRARRPEKSLGLAVAGSAVGGKN